FRRVLFRSDCRAQHCARIAEGARARRSRRRGRRQQDPSTSRAGRDGAHPRTTARFVTQSKKRGSLNFSRGRSLHSREGKSRSSTPPTLIESKWRCLRCSTCVGLPLDPKVNTLGIRSRGRTVQTRFGREALTAVAASHLLLRVESNGS